MKKKIIIIILKETEILVLLDSHFPTMIGVLDNLSTTSPHYQSLRSAIYLLRIDVSNLM